MMVLMPVICWNTAIVTPMTMTWRTAGLRTSRKLERRPDSSRTSAISASMPPLAPDPAQHLACFVLAPLRDQPVRALPLGNNIPVNIKTAGIAANPNISRQFWWDASP